MEPEKPFTLARVTFSVALVPCLIIRLVRLGLMLKSGPETATIVVWLAAPLVAVTVTLNWPSADDTVSPEVADVMVVDNVMLWGFIDTVAPPEETEAAKFTIPEKPFTPVTVTVELP